MQKADAKRLQRRIAQQPSVQNTRLFYVDSGRIYTDNSTYDSTKESGFGVEIQVSQYTGLPPVVLQYLVDANVSLTNSLTSPGLFRTVP